MTKKELMNELKNMNVKFNKDSKKEELEKLYNDNKKEEKEEMKEEETKTEEVKEEEKKEEVKKEKEDNFNKCVKNIVTNEQMIFSRMKDNSVAVKHETTNQKTRKKVVLYRVYASNKNKFRIDTTIESIFKDTSYETRKKSASVYFVIKNLSAEELQTTTKKLNENAKKYIFK